MCCISLNGRVRIPLSAEAAKENTELKIHQGRRLRLALVHRHVMSTSSLCGSAQATGVDSLRYGRHNYNIDCPPVQVRLLVLFPLLRRKKESFGSACRPKLNGCHHEPGHPGIGDDHPLSPRLLRTHPSHPSVRAKPHLEHARLA